MTLTVKRILLIVGIPFAFLLLGFLGLVGWYTWQLTQGSAETKLGIISQFDSAAFTAIANSSKRSQTIPNPSEYVRTHNPRFGSSSAPITIIAFIDFECPFCRRAYPEFEAIREKYSPVVQIVFKHFPLSSIHPNALPSAIAAQCAAQQNTFWQYYNQIFSSSLLSEEAYNTYASNVALNQSLFTRCQESSLTESQVLQDLQDGIDIGVRGTPTYVVNGTMVEGVVTESDWDTIILELLNQSNN